jgi:hypothetical protein
VAGGNSNEANADFSTVGGGLLNVASGFSSFASGGACNVAQGDFAVAIGSGAKANSDSSIVLNAEISPITRGRINSRPGQYRCQNSEFTCSDHGEGTVSICAPNGLFLNGEELLAKFEGLDAKLKAQDAKLKDNDAKFKDYDVMFKAMQAQIDSHRENALP